MPLRRCRSPLQSSRWLKVAIFTRMDELQRILEGDTCTLSSRDDVEDRRRVWTSRTRGAGAQNQAVAWLGQLGISTGGSSMSWTVGTVLGSFRKDDG